MKPLLQNSLLSSWRTVSTSTAVQDFASSCRLESVRAGGLLRLNRVARRCKAKQGLFHLEIPKGEGASQRNFGGPVSEPAKDRYSAALGILIDPGWSLEPTDSMTP
jgi:hypothetical protein